jgi:hypothetical protein
VSVGQPGGPFYLAVGGGGTAVADVFQDAGVEEHRVLLDEADLAAQGADFQAADVDAVKVDGAGRRVVEAEKQVGE